MPSAISVWGRSSGAFMTENIVFLGFDRTPSAARLIAGHRRFRDAIAWAHYRSGRRRNSQAANSGRCFSKKARYILKRAGGAM